MQSVCRAHDRRLGLYAYVSSNRMCFVETVVGGDSEIASRMGLQVPSANVPYWTGLGVVLGTLGSRRRWSHL